jgi:DNA-binding SARP family transcriptional activator
MSDHCSLEFRLLGAFEVIADGRSLDVGRGRRRMLLAYLLLQGGRVVSRSRLIEVLWGEDPPATAATALHGHISKLRRLLGPDRVQTVTPGYRLRLSPGELDLERFGRLIRCGRYADALSLWRGAPLAEPAFEGFARAEIARLEHLRRAALEGHFACELAAGRHMVLTSELTTALEDHPLCERLSAQLMIALYRSGRQAEALDVYRATRTRLVEQLGLEPGPELRELELRILAHDAALRAADERPGRLAA